MQLGLFGTATAQPGRVRVSTRSQPARALHGCRRGYSSATSNKLVLGLHPGDARFGKDESFVSLVVAQAVSNCRFRCLVSAYRGVRAMDGGTRSSLAHQPG